jgi:hypothetical protein
MKKQELLKGILIAALIILAALSRMVDHPMNFAPMAAIILFSVSVLPNNILKFAFPLATIVFSDILLQITTGFGFHSGTPHVYASFVLIGLIAYFLVNKEKPLTIIMGSIVGSFMFFLITNFAFLYPGAAVSNPLLGVYSHDLNGVIASYQSAIPFFKNTLLGDLFYNVMLFGSYYLIMNFVFKSEKATA